MNTPFSFAFLLIFLRLSLLEDARNLNNSKFKIKSLSIKYLIRVVGGFVFFFIMTSILPYEFFPIKATF